MSEECKKEQIPVNTTEGKEQHPSAFYYKITPEKVQEKVQYLDKFLKNLFKEAQTNPPAQELIVNLAYLFEPVLLRFHDEIHSDEIANAIRSVAQIEEFSRVIRLTYVFTLEHFKLVTKWMEVIDLEFKLYDKEGHEVSMPDKWEERK